MYVSAAIKWVSSPLKHVLAAYKPSGSEMTPVLAPIDASCKLPTAIANKYEGIVIGISNEKVIYVLSSETTPGP
jgi:hypothetical protein